jgi:hypothetical protein
MVAAHESTVVDREIACRLRRAMVAARLDGKQMARRLDQSEVRISRWLTGKHPISEVDAAAFLVVCGIGTRSQGPVLRLVRERDLLVPLRLGGAELAAAGYGDHFGDAVCVTEFACVGLPMLVQTAEYARAQIQDAPNTDDQSAWLAVHEQATNLFHRSRPEVRVLVHEWVVRTPVGGAVVMADQLDHLVRLSAWRHVSVRVLPISAQAAGVTPFGLAQFGLAEFPDRAPVLYRHEVDGLLLRDDPAEVAHHQAVFDHLHSFALDDDASRALLVRIAADHPRLAAVAG